MILTKVYWSQSLSSEMAVKLNEKKLRFAEIEAFKNGLRLHFDAIKLFQAGAYPSSYFLSVIALEEFGKQRLIDEIVHLYWEHRSDFGSDKEFQAFCKDLEKALLSHSVKQGFSVRDDFPFTKGHNRMQKGYLYQMFSTKQGRKKIDEWKMRAIYVGFDRNSLKGKIQTPSRFVSRKRAMDQITAMNDYLINFTIFIRQGRWVLDSEALTRYINRPLLKKLLQVWKPRHKDTQKRVNEFLKTI